MTKQFTLGKTERLKSRKQIEQLFSEGKNFVIQPYRIYYFFSVVNDKNEHLQFGIGVSNKNFKKAVDRNRVKRLTREAYRLRKAELKKLLETKKLHLNVFFVYTSKELPDFNTVKEKLDLILNKLSKLANEKNPSDT